MSVTEGRVGSKRTHHADDERHRIVSIRLEGGGCVQEKFLGSNLIERTTHLSGNKKSVMTGEFIVIEGELHGTGSLVQSKNGVVKKRLEGEFKNGKLHGAGKQYRADGSVAYEGQWENDEQHGFGKQYHPDGSVKYEGQYEMDRWHGAGKMYYPDGSLHYEGQYEMDRRHGTGKMYCPDGTSVGYEGQWKNGEQHGFGTQYQPDGKYEGQFVENKLHGKATYTKKDNGGTYEGRFEMNEWRSMRPLHQADGSKGNYDGQLKKGKKHGEGKYTYDDGSEYQGQFKEGLRHGKGKLTHADGHVVYEGKWVDDTEHDQKALG